MNTSVLCRICQLKIIQMIVKTVIKCIRIVSKGLIQNRNVILEPHDNYCCIDINDWIRKITDRTGEGDIATDLIVLFVWIKGNERSISVWNYEKQYQSQHLDKVTYSALKH